MNSNRTFSRRPFCSAVILASLWVGLGGLAQAQTQPADPPQAHACATTHDIHTKMNARQGQALAVLKDKLKLQTSQETTWTTFAQNMQMPMPQMRHTDPAALAKLTTPERIAQMQAHKASHDAVVQARAEATQTFYATLESAQKQVFDTETAQHRHGRGYRMAHASARHEGQHGHP